MSSNGVTGHQVEDPRYVQEQVSFALDEARKGGWKPWHGWKGDRWAGIRGRRRAATPCRRGRRPARGYFNPGDTYQQLGVANPAATWSPRRRTTRQSRRTARRRAEGRGQGKDARRPLGELGKPPPISAPVPNVLPRGGRRQRSNHCRNTSSSTLPCACRALSRAVAWAAWEDRALADSIYKWSLTAANNDGRQPHQLAREPAAGHCQRQCPRR